jgi:ABC-2 type transport system ATP-binding protein
VVERALVTARGLAKAYGDHLAVKEVDLELEPGEVVGFLGPNGAGKTTVLRVLTGALRATAGEVRVLGHDPWRDPVAVHRGLGYVPGDLRLPGRVTGHDLLQHLGRLRGRPAEARELADLLQVPLDVPVAHRSKGNRQKGGLVQAFMGDPQLLLLDEPSSGLDPLTQEVLDDLVRRAGARGAGVLLSSHVLSEVEAVADRVVLLRQGRVVGVSRLDEMRAAAPHQVEVRSSGALDIERLADVPGVSSLEVCVGRATFTTTAAALPEVLAVLARADVVDLSVTPADLESLFLSFYAESPV